MIVGTAGHIDHGKTTLVRALTGVDTDRLPEEKQRGISIELGYAFLDTPSGARIGFIDVPGHERLVHTMLAGATGIDCALLLVAADDGVMPQTREHLAVLSLLGVQRGAVVVTKADRVDAARVRRGARRSRCAAARHAAGAVRRCFAVSAPRGDGVAELHAAAVRAARVRARDDADAQQAFRLAIDRAFTLDGVGTVVTGTVHAGRVQVGDELAIAPAGPRTPVRVRSLHAQNRAVPRCGAGPALRGGAGRRGQGRGRNAASGWWRPRRALATDRIDVALAALARRGEGTALRHAGARARRRQRHAGQRGRARRAAMRWRPAHAPACSWCCGGRSPRGMATAWCCATPRPRARWPAAACSIRSRRHAIGARRSDWPNSTPQRSTRRRARLHGVLAASPRGVDVPRWARAEGVAARGMAARCRTLRCAHAATVRRRSCSRAAHAQAARAAALRRAARPTTRATATNSAPMRRACGAWPRRNCPIRCGASCWPR